jgi:hypothetical protein
LSHATQLPDEHSEPAEQSRSTLHSIVAPQLHVRQPLMFALVPASPDGQLHCAGVSVSHRIHTPLQSCPLGHSSFALQLIAASPGFGHAAAPAPAAHFELRSGKSGVLQLALRPAQTSAIAAQRTNIAILSRASARSNRLTPSASVKPIEVDRA